MSKLNVSTKEEGINVISLGKQSAHFTCPFKHCWPCLHPSHSILDAGSPGGALSQIYILAEFMRRLKEKLGKEEDLLPADFFDLIGGSGLGA